MEPIILEIAGAVAGHAGRLAKDLDKESLTRLGLLVKGRLARRVEDMEALAAAEQDENRVEELAHTIRAYAAEDGEFLRDMEKLVQKEIKIDSPAVTINADKVNIGQQFNGPAEFNGENRVDFG
ncbi:hypothetical protein [Salininema proteolyticum]|uniref:Uncharacterized protein n=1 Tax=Salininema proteolyticum TaxID=1607685 RepID=A0ABV8TZC1_9ACTN